MVEAFIFLVLWTPYCTPDFQIIPTAKLISSQVFQFYWCYDLSIDVLSGSGSSDLMWSVNHGLEKMIKEAIPF